MLNLQQAKVLSVLINNYGITDDYDISIPGHANGILDIIIDQIESNTCIKVTRDTAMNIQGDGWVFPETVYRLTYDQQKEAEYFYQEAVEHFIKEGIPIDFLH